MDNMFLPNKKKMATITATRWTGNRLIFVDSLIASSCHVTLPRSISVSKGGVWDVLRKGPTGKQGSLSVDKHALLST